MSIVINICGENFCMLGADRRQVSYNKDGVMSILTDEAHKVFRLNDHVLFGTAGLFLPSETFFDPFNSFCHLEYISICTAAKALERYVQTLSPNHELTRQYTLSGKDDKGRFCMYTLSSAHSFIPEWIVLEKDQFYVQFMSQDKIVNQHPLAQKHIFNTMPWGTVENLRQHVEDLIRDYSSVDPTVGGNPEIFVLT